MTWLILVSLLCPQGVAARRAVREIAELFGREAAERAEPRIVKVVELMGDDAVRALRKAGPAGLDALEKFGAPAARILDRWGDDGTRLLLTEGDAAVHALGRWGDDAVEFMVRHPGVGGDLLRHFGADALRAKISTEGAVILSRLADPIRSSGRAAQLFDVVERFGDRACAFLWRHKGTIFVTAVLVSFLSDPQPYLEGVKELLVAPASGLAMEAVRRADWTLIFLIVFGVALFLGWATRRRPARTVAFSGGPP